MNAPFNRHGGLTLLPMPGFRTLADAIAARIAAVGSEEGGTHTPVDIAEPEFGLRSSGEPFLRLGKRHVGGHDVVVLTSGPGTYEMLGQTEFVLQYLVGRRARRIALVTGYFPLSRSDKDEGEFEFALVGFVTKKFMDAADGRLDRIIAADLHAPQSVSTGRIGLITEVTMAKQVLRAAIADVIAEGGRPVVAFTDDGSVKRAGPALARVEAELGIGRVPVVQGSKRRKSEDVELLNVYGDVDAVRGATVIGFDDEIATAKTNLANGKAMRVQYGAAAYHAAVTHGVFRGGAAERFLAPDCPVDRIYCAETIPVASRPELASLMADGRLRVVEGWDKKLAWAIHNHHWDESIRDSAH